MYNVNPSVQSNKALSELSNQSFASHLTEGKPLKSESVVLYNGSV